MALAYPKVGDIKVHKKYVNFFYYWQYFKEATLYLVVNHFFFKYDTTNKPFVS